MKRDAETDFDADDYPACGVLEDLEAFIKVEWLVDLGGAVNSHPFICEALFIFFQKASFGRGPWEIPVRDEGENYGAAAFNEKQVAPIGEGPCGDLEDTKGKEA